MRHNASTYGAKNSSALTPWCIRISNWPIHSCPCWLDKWIFKAHLSTAHTASGLSSHFNVFSFFCLSHQYNFSTAPFPSHRCCPWVWLPDPLSLIKKTVFPNLVSSVDFINMLFVFLARYFQRVSNNVDNHCTIKVRERSFFFFLRMKRDRHSVVFNSSFAQKTDKIKRAEIDFF